MRFRQLPSMLRNGVTRFMEVELFGKTDSTSFHSGLISVLGVLARDQVGFMAVGYEAGAYAVEATLACQRRALCYKRRHVTGVAIIASTSGERTMDHVGRKLDGSPGWFQLGW